MRMDVRRRHEHHAVPWRNGGGITHEVARGPVDTAGEEFDWRVSVAEVTKDGPFSAYPGVDRVIMVVDGQGMTLTVDGARHELSPHEPFAFRGESAVHSTVSGPTRDLNVMTRRERARARVDVLTAHRPELVDSATPLVLVCVAGTVQVAPPGQPVVQLANLDAALWWGDDPVSVEGPGVVVVARVLVADEVPK